MAADKPLTEAQKELARNLPEPERPKNFRCVKGDHLALEAFRLPCCDKPICADCLPTLVDKCPQCSHSPISPDSCTPHKSVRKSIKALVNKKEKKLLEAAKNATAPTEETPKPADTTNVETTGAADSAVPTVESAPDVKDGASEQTTDKPQSTVQDKESKSPETSNQPPPQRTGSAASNRPAPATKNARARPKSASKDDDDPVMRQWRQNHSPTRVLDANTFTYEHMGWGPTSLTHQKAVEDHMVSNNVQFFPNGLEIGMSDDNYHNGAMNGLISQVPAAMQNLIGLNNGNIGLPNMNAMSMNNMMGQGMYPMFGQMDMAGMAGMNPLNMGANFGMTGNNWGGQMLGGDFGSGMDGNFPIGGFNQSGGGQFGHMANQIPRNNFPKHNRFQGNGNFAQQRNFGRGSHHPHGNFGVQNNFGPHQNRPNHATSRTGSQDTSRSAFVPHNRRRSGSMSREGPQSAHNSDPSAPEQKSSTPANGGNEVLHSNDGPDKAFPVKSVDGKAGTTGSGEGQTVPGESLSAQAEPANNNAHEVNGLTQTAVADTFEDNSTRDGELKAIQTVDTLDDDRSIGHEGVEPYSHGPGYSHGYMPRTNGYSSNAYGSTTVLTPGEPQGLGVEGAPTGPRAMREGRQNKASFSRANKLNGLPSGPSVATIHETASNGHTRGRSKTPQRDDSLRIKPKSPSRSRSRSTVKEGDGVRGRGRSPSPSRHRKRRHERSRSSSSDADYERRKKARHYRTSRHDEYNDRSRDDHYEKPEKAYDRPRDDHYEKPEQVHDMPRDDHDEKHEQAHDRSRSSSVDSGNHRSRQDKDRYHSSRRQERTHDYRRSQRSRSRSRSPIAESRYEDDRVSSRHDTNHDSSSHRKSRTEKYRERDKDRDYDYDRRDKDRKHGYSREYDEDYDRDYDRKSEREYKKEYDREDRHERSRDKEYDREKKRSSRRDRSADAHDEYARSSRRSRKDREKDHGKERERGRDRGREDERDYRETAPVEPRAVSPPLNAPTGPAAEAEFKIMGRSKAKQPAPIKTGMAPPTGPRSSQVVFQPPTGPAADRSRDRTRDGKDVRENRDRYDEKDRAREISKDGYNRRGSNTPLPQTPLTPITPTGPSAANKFKPISKDTNDTKRGDRATDLLIRQMHNRAHGGTAAPVSNKRGRNDFEPEDPIIPSAVTIPQSINTEVPPSSEQAEKSKDEKTPTFAPPTGPAAHRNKRRKSDDAAGQSLDTRLMFALRARARGGGMGSRRRGGIRFEGDENGEDRARRVEREREGSRFNGR